MPLSTWRLKNDNRKSRRYYRNARISRNYTVRTRRTCRLLYQQFSSSIKKKKCFIGRVSNYGEHATYLRCGVRVDRKRRIFRETEWKNYSGIARSWTEVYDDDHENRDRFNRSERAASVCIANVRSTIALPNNLCARPLGLRCLIICARVRSDYVAQTIMLRVTSRALIISNCL